MTQPYPVQSHQSAPSPGDQPQDFAERCDKILIVDDEVEVAEEVADCLEFQGYDCMVASNGFEAMKLIKEVAELSMVIADIRMPDMSGLELCEIVKNNLPAEREIVFIFLTGHAGLSESIEAIRIGGFDFLTKPVSPELLRHSVKRAVQHIKANSLRRRFNENLETEVKEKTRSLRIKTEKLEIANSKLTLANQVKDEFLTMINHEIRTPLNVVIGFAGIVEEDVSNQEHLAWVKRIKEAGLNLTKMFNSITDMIAIGTETLQLQKSDVQVGKFIEKTISAYSNLADSKEVSINANEVHDIVFSLDEFRISQALDRLIDNAVKFSPQGGAVTVLTQQTDQGLSISIRDQGPGMSRANQEKALQPLSQIDGSTTREHGGIGLGLTLANMVAKLHGGSLCIESEPFQGTKISIILPR